VNWEFADFEDSWLWPEESHPSSQTAVAIKTLYSGNPTAVNGGLTTASIFNAARHRADDGVVSDDPLSSAR
jgi:hypothetical protein